MKFTTKLFFIFSLLSNTLFFSQYLKVEYEQYDRANIEDASLSKEFNDKVKEVLKKPKTFFLYYANGYSFFKSIPRKSFTNNAGDLKEGNNSIHNREIYGEVELRLFHYKNDNGTYNYHFFPNLNEEFYGYKDSKFAKIEYKDETINIDKYLCKLVEVSPDSINNYKIWFTEDIPVSAGPYVFNSFPGLVLRIEAPNYTITAIKISNETKEADVEKLNPKIKVYKNEDYDKKMQQIREEQSKPTTEEIRL